MKQTKTKIRPRKHSQASGLFDELIVDNFAGGGGASAGIELALGRAVDIAINHDRAAIEMHMANHPHTRHLCEDVWSIDPIEVCAGRPVGLVWLSPDCKHFSRAKGGKPMEKRIRGLAWIAVKWAKAVRPRVIILENVREFQEWGPLTNENLPCPERKGLTFRRFIGSIRNLGYSIEWKILNAADYGTPTHRRRLFIIARRDGLPITWPEPTHGPGRTPYRTASECIDWSMPCPSIFLTKEEAHAIGAKRPLAEKTMRRIAMGLKRYVLDNPNPFIINIERSYKDFAGQSINNPLGTITASPKGGKHALIMPFIARQNHGKKQWNSVEEPATTITTQINKQTLISAFLSKHYGGVIGHGIERPIGTITAIDHHSIVAAHPTQFRGSNIGNGGNPRDPMPAITAQGTHIAEVRAFLVKYFGQGCGSQCDEPLHTVTSRDRFGLVIVEGQSYQIIDIGLRMLSPRELARAQGFPDSYILTGSKSSQVARIGNSVCPPIAAAIVKENCGPQLYAGVA